YVTDLKNKIENSITGPITNAATKLYSGSNLEKAISNSSIVQWFKKTFPSSDGPDKFDLGAAVALVGDYNSATARIGDGSDTATVTAGGGIQVLSQINSSPSVGSTSQVSDDTTATKKPATKFGGAIALTAGVYVNDAEAFISDKAIVNSQGTLNVEADALNAISPMSLWGATLVSPFLSSNTAATHETSDGIVDVNNGDTVDVPAGYTDGGDAGTRYKYIGTGGLIDLSTADYSDTTQWQTYGNEAENMANFWTTSTASGEQTEAAGAITLLGMYYTADASIKDGASINQNAALRNGSQNVTVQGNSTDETVAIDGNFSLPALDVQENSWKPGWSWGLFGTKTEDGEGAAGGGLMVQFDGASV